MVKEKEKAENLILETEKKIILETKNHLIENQVSLDQNEPKDLHPNLKMKGMAEKTHRVLAIDLEEKVVLEIEKKIISETRNHSIANQVSLDLNEKKDLDRNQKTKDTVEKIHPVLATGLLEKVALKIEIEMDFNPDQSNHTLKIKIHPLLKSLVETTSLEL